MNKTTIVVLSLLFALLFPVGVSAAAAGNCKPIYGGGESCLPQNELAIDKKVLSPISKKFVDNLSASEIKLKAGDSVSFEVTITNKGKETLKEVEATDKLPGYMIFNSGPGNYNAKTRTINFRFNNLKANESRKFILAGTINDVGKATCVVNYVSVKSGKLKADDNSRFCLEKSICVEGQSYTTKGGFPVMPAPIGMTETPATGPEMLPLLSLLPLGLAGIYIRKRSN